MVARAELGFTWTNLMYKDILETLQIMHILLFLSFKSKAEVQVFVPLFGQCKDL